MASDHSRGVSDYAFPFFSQKTRKKGKARLPPAPLVRALTGPLKNIGSANGLCF